MASIPTQTKILVIGGGPSGSFTASALAREGFDVTLLEADSFPRYHIGESLLPSVRPFLQFIDAEKKVIEQGFCSKPGAAIKFNQHKREGYTDFIARGPEFGSWNVVRSEFDNIVFRHAAASGAKVFDKVKVSTIEFEKQGDPKSRPIAANYQTADGKEGRIAFDYLVDSSGRNGVMSTKYLKNRHTNESLKNIAIWGYWENFGRYKPGTDRENAIWIEALTDETGWAWFIPLAENLVSVGLVINHAQSITKRNAFREKAGADSTLQDFYLDQVKLSPGLYNDFIPNAKMVQKEDGPMVRQASDYSYSANGYAGIGYRLAGDAACFIDPFFSSGVHLAFTGGLSAAGTIASSIRGVASEEECAKWHDAKISISYTRFMLVVLGAYKQMRSQQIDILSDVGADNFDRAFDLLRPIIQGTADVNKKVTEDEVQDTMDFVKNVFAPTDPELEAAVKQRVDPKFFAGGESDIILPSQTQAMFEDEDVRNVMDAINARKPVHRMYDTQRDFGSEPINGYTLRLVRGELQLVKTEGIVGA
ncbi:Tryptophan 2-halogenase [Leucoagaricus sp. SymC.cos]|nr:Tryptophan 2-halogenase [Leucoagaricus sp. SymC.cos]